MEIVKCFESTEFSIVMEGDQIWWWGVEVAEAFGYINASKAISRHVKEDEKRIVVRW